MSEMAAQIAKAIFVGNIKGGVGKSTLTVYLTEYLRRRFKRQSVVLIDTDPQGTSFELMEPKSKSGDVRFLPVGDRYDGVNMSTLDGVLRRLLAQNENIAVVDTGAGKLASASIDHCDIFILCKQAAKHAIKRGHIHPIITVTNRQKSYITTLAFWFHQFK